MSAVFQHDECNALIIEERGPLMALMVHRQMGVAATRTAYHGSARCLLRVGQVYGEFGLVFLVAAGIGCPVGPQIHLQSFLLRLRRHRKRHQQHDQSKHFHLLWYDMKCVSTLDFCTYFLECISDEVVCTRLFGFHIIISVLAYGEV